MPVVLSDRVLEVVLHVINDLCPLWTFSTAEYPAAKCFGLNHEDSVSTDEHVINLGSSIFKRKGDVVQ